MSLDSTVWEARGSAWWRAQHHHGSRLKPNNWSAKPMLLPSFGPQEGVIPTYLQAQTHQSLGTCDWGLLF